MEDKIEGRGAAGRARSAAVSMCSNENDTECVQSNILFIWVRRVVIAAVLCSFSFNLTSCSCCCYRCCCWRCYCVVDVCTAGLVNGMMMDFQNQITTEEQAEMWAVFAQQCEKVNICNSFCIRVESQHGTSCASGSTWINHQCRNQHVVNVVNCVIAGTRWKICW